MAHFAPQLHAACLQPGIQGAKSGEAWHRQPQPPAPVLHALLDLAFLPARRRITELRIKQIVAGHGCKARIDLSGLARPGAVNRRLHVIEDSAGGRAAQHPEGLAYCCVKQHLMRLQRLGPLDEGPAVRQFGVS